MATPREYFDADFDYALKVHVRLSFNDEDIEAIVVYDLSGHKAFLSCYVPGANHDLAYFVRGLAGIRHGETPLEFEGRVTLPSARYFPGKIHCEKSPGKFEIQARFHGDPSWISVREIQTSKPARVFIYTEADLAQEEILTLKHKGIALGHEIQFRGAEHAAQRARLETPLAFVSHDSRDKDVARAIALKLQSMLYPVWYDEFSLKVGDNLRYSIESGLKACKNA